jgi:hypothetical protein
MFGIVTDGLLARMLSKQELDAYVFALSKVSLGAVVGSLGLPKQNAPWRSLRLSCSGLRCARPAS